MDKKTTFSYNYSAKENTEIREIRKKYLPCEENRLDELRRLDYTVQTSGMLESLTAGFGGALLFGLGICLSMHVIGSGALAVALGVLLGLAGMVGMLAAYPVYRKIFNDTKARLTPRILELSSELSGAQK